MRIAVLGASGTIGAAVADALSSKHDVVRASRNSGELRVDISSRESLEQFYKELGEVDAIVNTAGGARFSPLAQLTDEDFAFSIANKLMGNVNVVRLGINNVRAGGSITVTTGILAQEPIVGSGAISLVNAAVEGFGRAAALEAPNGIRVNVVSPPWVSETLSKMGRDPSTGVPAAKVADAYVASVQGRMTGQVIDARAFA